MTGVPRDPSEFWPTEHAVVRKKERGVDWDDVAHAIQHGQTSKSWSKDNAYLYSTGDVTVAADVEDGAILTVTDGSIEDFAPDTPPQRLYSYQDQ